MDSLMKAVNTNIEALVKFCDLLSRLLTNIVSQIEQGIRTQISEELACFLSKASGYLKDVLFKNHRFAWSMVVIFVASLLIERYAYNSMKNSESKHGEIANRVKEHDAEFLNDIGKYLQKANDIMDEILKTIEQANETVTKPQMRILVLKLNEAKRQLESVEKIISQGERGIHACLNGYTREHKINLAVPAICFIGTTCAAYVLGTVFPPLFLTTPPFSFTGRLSGVVPAAAVGAANIIQELGLWRECLKKRNELEVPNLFSTWNQCVKYENIELANGKWKVLEANVVDLTNEGNRIQSGSFSKL